MEINGIVFESHAILYWVVSVLMLVAVGLGLSVKYTNSRASTPPASPSPTLNNKDSSSPLQPTLLVTAPRIKKTRINK